MHHGLLDIFIGKLSGLNVARHLQECGCSAKIVFLTIHEDPDFVNAAMGAGGNAFVVKSRVSTDLVPAIKAVLANKLFVSPSLLHRE
jgi:DNA-binding NarL/FixJ family response regulator